MSLPRIPTTVNVHDHSFRERELAFRVLIHDFTTRMAHAALGGPEDVRIRHESRGKLLPRNRVAQLLDPGSPFLELSPLAANGM
jgi:3-methylcrotonyl-CoA carboxylase beta subunit